jgi:glucuronate isomerase
MRTFIHEDFLLHCESARRLYQEFGAALRMRKSSWHGRGPFRPRCETPFYHWTHLELAFPFEIRDQLLDESTAAHIYPSCNEQLTRPEFSACGLMKQYRVEVVCTTDDPADSLEWHSLYATRRNHARRATEPPGTSAERGALSVAADGFRAALLHELAVWDPKTGWVQQFHIGAMRDNNSKKHVHLCPNTGFDSIGDGDHVRRLATLLDRLNSEDSLAKTISYNLNPRDNEAFATLIGNFQDGVITGKTQLGSAWWFLDQLDGMPRQLDVLFNMGLLAFRGADRLAVLRFLLPSRALAQVVVPNVGRGDGERPSA